MGYEERLLDRGGTDGGGTFRGSCAVGMTGTLRRGCSNFGLEVPGCEGDLLGGTGGTCRVRETLLSEFCRGRNY